MQSTPLQIPQLTFTRFIAAISVVVFHYGQKVFPFREGVLNSLAKEGGIAVSYFFFLSGFLLYVVYSNTDFSFRKFFAARFARVFPLYMLAFLMTLFLILFFLDQRPKGITIILQAFFMHAWFPGHALAVNYPSWSVSVEVFFYALFPVLLVVSRKIKPALFILGACIFWAASIFQYSEIQKYFYDPSSRIAGEFILYFPLWHLNTFISGIAAGIFFLLVRQKHFMPGWLPLLSAIVGLVFLLLILLTENNIKVVMTNGLLAPFYALIVIGIALDKTIISKWMSIKIFQFLGEISYGIYLLQYAVRISATGIVQHLNWQAHPTITFYSFIFLLMFIASLAYLFVEKPARIIMRKYFKADA